MGPASHLICENDLTLTTTTYNTNIIPFKYCWMGYVYSIDYVSLYEWDNLVLISLQRRRLAMTMAMPP
jgi:hypothetical protein